MFIKYFFKNSMGQSPWPSLCLTYSNKYIIEFIILNYMFIKYFLVMLVMLVMLVI